MKVCPCNSFRRPVRLLNSFIIVRKAYRKRALETHPDKLDPGANEKEKQEAERQFHEVNICPSGYSILRMILSCKDFSLGS